MDVPVTFLLQVYTPNTELNIYKLCHSVHPMLKQFPMNLKRKITNKIFEKQSILLSDDHVTKVIIFN